MDWSPFVWVPLAALFLAAILIQIGAWVYGFKRARRTGAGFWAALAEGAATATGNNYIVHTCEAKK